jgi:hypothetical protein
LGGNCRTGSVLLIGAMNARQASVATTLVLRVSRLSS